MASEERQVTSESVVSMSIGQLKTFLTKYGVPFADCVEKTELRVRAAETLQKLASQELKPAAAAAAAAPQPESQDGVQSVGKGGGDPAEVEKRPEQLAALEVVELLPQLARIPEISERRQITEQVYDIKMRGWKQDRRYRGMAHHLIEDVHSYFRQGFPALLSRGKVDVKAFKSINNSLHHHHSLEDRAWFPKLKRNHPEFKRQVDILEADHAKLVQLENEIVEQQSFAALTEFVNSLMDHLRREEMISVPFLMDGTGGL